MPLDKRPVVRAETPPPPVSGGTLALTTDGNFAVVADSDRDRVVLVDMASRRVVRTVQLATGDEPGRVVAGPGQQAFVALRRGGAIVTIDAEQGLIARRQVCGAPRGLAYDASADELHVACAEGKLVSFAGAAPTPARSLSLDTDLRDVILGNGKLFVTRFRSAELLEVDGDGHVATRRRPPTLPGQVRLPERLQGDSGSPFGRGNFDSSVAWRAVPGPDGILMVHQRAQLDVVALGGSERSEAAYGGGGDAADVGCGGVVRGGLTEFTADGTTVSRRTIGAALLVDVAVSPLGHVAMASAGTVDSSAPKRDGDQRLSDMGGIVLFPGPVARDAGADSGASDDSHLADGSAGDGPGDDVELDTVDRCLEPERLLSEPAVAVAFDVRNPNLLLAQTRSLARIHFIDLETRHHDQVELGGVPVMDTAHELFHRSPGFAMACASCHPEGMDDGRVWVFDELGPRRTQALNTRLEGTAPFHWDGELPGVSELMNVVFVSRMGGVRESRERLQALESWMFGLKPLPPRRSVQEPGVDRGRDLFFSESVGCSSCHSGASFTNNGNYDVGTTLNGEALQVPGLIGVGHRAPLMHDGCAKTLHERFDPTCGGGDRHGRTSTLSSDDIDALVAYLETL